MNSEELTLTMSDEFQLYAFVAKPNQPSKGHVHLLHGMAEHIGRYESTVQYLLAQGYVVSGHDHRGHGKTIQLNGTQGYFGEDNGFERVVQDVEEVLEAIQSTLDQKLTLILMGHSMGSFIARRYVQRYPARAQKLVLSGTGDDGGLSRYAGEKIAHVMGKKEGFTKENHLLDNLIFKGFNRQIKRATTDFDWLSENDYHVREYIADELCGFVGTTQFYLDLFYGIRIIHEKSEIAKMNVDVPILLVSGEEDPVGNYGKALWKVARQYDEAEVKKVTVLLFAHGRHELLNDESRPEVIRVVESWMSERE